MPAPEGPRSRLLRATLLVHHAAEQLSQAAEALRRAATAEAAASNQLFEALFPPLEASPPTVYEEPRNPRSITIEEVLSGRAVNALTRHTAIRTLGDLERWGALALLEIPGFGQVCLNDVREELRLRGLHLATDPHVRPAVREAALGRDPDPAPNPSANPAEKPPATGEAP